MHFDDEMVSEGSLLIWCHKHTVFCEAKKTIQLARATFLPRPTDEKHSLAPSCVTSLLHRPRLRKNFQEPLPPPPFRIKHAPPPPLPPCPLPPKNYQCSQRL